MKNILRNVTIAFILILTMASTIASAQSEPVKEQAVDQSNVIFKGCQLGNLVKKEDIAKPLTEQQLNGEKSNIDETGRDGYIKNCIQDIIRFIIVIASLAAILKIAASGLAMLDPSGSKVSQSLTSRSTITNLVIGLFLLIVGWNLIPILNASFNNVDFLNIPGTDHCNLANSNCTTQYTIQASESKEALGKYQQAEKDKKIVIQPSQLKSLKEDLATYCKNVVLDEKTNKFKEAYIKDGIAKTEYQKICKVDYSTEIDKWATAGKEGVSGKEDGITSALVAYNAAIQGYKKVATGSSATEKDAAKKKLVDICSKENISVIENIKATFPPEATEAIKNCKKIQDTKTREATIAELIK